MPAIAVKGTHDILGKEADGYRYIERVFEAVAQLYGYQEFRIPTLEYTDVFNRSTGEGSDVVRKEMYTFLDKGNRSVTMRPEFTAGVARAIVEHKLYATEDLPIKCFYYGPVFRYERPQLGRYRQFHQAGVECIGVNSARFDAECICLAMQVLGMLGFKGLHLKINSLGDEASRKAYRDALKAYFAEHIDDMCADCHERLELNPMRILDCKVEHDQEIAKGAPKMKDYLSEESEKRCYQTVYGPWYYLTADDGQIDLARHSTLMIGTLESCLALRAYYGADKVVPVYIEVEDGERLQRALDRERSEKMPKYRELCRRFLADCEDFSEEKIAEAGITKRFYNDDLQRCRQEIEEYLAEMM